MKKVLAFLALGFTVVVSSYFCWGIDYITLGGQGPAYWWFAVPGAVVTGLLLMVLTRHLIGWGLYGLWAGTLLLLPWIPYNFRKPFVHDAQAVKYGMSVQDVRMLLSRYDDKPLVEPDSYDDVTYQFRLDPTKVNSDGCLTVYTRNGVVFGSNLHISY